jgi:catechol 2,3-dioxygenase-like lactoylglutathione lyase family enzyme
MNKIESNFQTINNLSHVGFVVKDIDRTIEFISSIWDIGPSQKLDYSPSKDEIIAGEPFSLKVGFVNLGVVMLELIQPVSESLWSQFLKEHGEGIQHIAFGVSNYDEIVSRFLKRGHPMVTSASYKGLRWCYFQTQPGGILVEFRDEFKVVL